MALAADEQGRGTGTEPIEWYTLALRNVLEATAVLDDDPRNRRERRLTALPLVGVGQGGASAKRGEVITAVLNLLDERAMAGQDSALVLWNDRDHAAVQHVRRLRNEKLPDGTQEAAARALADRARRRELALSTEFHEFQRRAGLSLPRNNVAGRRVHPP